MRNVRSVLPFTPRSPAPRSRAQIEPSDTDRHLSVLTKLLRLALAEQAQHREIALKVLLFLFCVFNTGA
jgi:hypothetical protein